MIDVIDQVPGLAARAGELRKLMVERRLEARAWTRATGEDLPDVGDWAWPGPVA